MQIEVQASRKMETTKAPSFIPAFVSIVIMFFFWGFVASSNGILIPVFKKSFALTQTQSQLVDSAFYLAYAVGSFMYFVLSISVGDLLNKIGYKKGLIAGLVVSACGALIFLPAAQSTSYALFLTGLFTIGLGFALLQIVANPFVINLGDPSKGSNRLNFAGGINSLGTTVGPVLLALALFGRVSPAGGATLSLGNVIVPYVALAVVLLILAVIIAFVPIPAASIDESTERSIGALRFPQLILGMLAIFVYVGTEVTIPSNMAALLKLPEIKGIDQSGVDKYISLYWGSLMIGRLTGALRTFRLSNAMYALLSVVVPFAVFGLVMAVNTFRGTDVADLWVYAAWVALFIIIKFLGQEKPARTLCLFGVAAACFMVVGLYARGDIALFSFVSGGLFCSVMWPCIFNLAIAGLGRYTNQASSLLIMMILGGAAIPPLQGWLADKPGIGIHLSYWVPVVGFAYLAWYGYGAKRILLKQGIDYDTAMGSGH
jgi:MFS transporter, FHS family, L-fucose permease